MVASGDAFTIEQRVSPQATGPARRPAPTAVAPGISRQAEFAYIRSDMRRLLIIAGSLLGLMLVLLMFVER